MAPHYEKGSSTNAGKLFIAEKPHHGWLYINDVIIVAKTDFAPPKFFAGCGPGYHTVTFIHTTPGTKGGDRDGATPME